MIGPENTHRCRIHPHEAAIYSLEAEGEGLDMFKTISKAELTLQIDETKERKIQPSVVELPVTFSKKDVAKARFYLWTFHLFYLGFTV